MVSNMHIIIIFCFNHADTERLVEMFVLEELKAVLFL